MLIEYWFSEDRSSDPANCPSWRFSSKTLTLFVTYSRPYPTVNPTPPLSSYISLVSTYFTRSAPTKAT